MHFMQKRPFCLFVLERIRQVYERQALPRPDRIRSLKPLFWSRTNFSSLVIPKDGVQQLVNWCLPKKTDQLTWCPFRGWVRREEDCSKSRKSLSSESWTFCKTVYGRLIIFKTWTAFRICGLIHFRLMVI